MSLTTKTHHHCGRDLAELDKYYEPEITKYGECGLRISGECPRNKTKLCHTKLGHIWQDNTLSIEKWYFRKINLTWCKLFLGMGNIDRIAWRLAISRYIYLVSNSRRHTYTSFRDEDDRCKTLNCSWGCMRCRNVKSFESRELINNSCLIKPVCQTITLTWPSNMSNSSINNGEGIL